MSELFNHDKLKANTNDHIEHMRDWLNRIERDVKDDTVCVNASMVIDLGNEFSKLAYVIGMLNNLRFTQHDVARKRKERK